MLFSSLCGVLVVLSSGIHVMQWVLCVYTSLCEWHLPVPVGREKKKCIVLTLFRLYLACECPIPVGRSRGIVPTLLHLCLLWRCVRLYPVCLSLVSHACSAFVVVALQYRFVASVCGVRAPGCRLR